MSGTDPTKPVRWQGDLAAYYANPGIDYSRLKLLSTDYPGGGPESYHKYATGKWPPLRPNLSMRIGSALDEILFPRPNDGPPAIDTDSAILEPAAAMAQSARRNPFIADLLECPGIVQQPYTWVDDASGLDLKAMPDKIIPPGHRWERRHQPFAFVVELKSARDPRPAQFASDAGRLLYHLQLAFYVDLVSRLFDCQVFPLWIVVGNRPPHIAWTPYPKDDWLDLGRRLLARLLWELKHRLTTGDWSNQKPSPGRAAKTTRRPAGYWKEPKPIGLPTPWSLRKAATTEGRTILDVARMFYPGGGRTAD